VRQPFIRAVDCAEIVVAPGWGVVREGPAALAEAEEAPLACRSSLRRDTIGEFSGRSGR
jgi:hypothetical protein